MNSLSNSIMPNCNCRVEETAIMRDCKKPLCPATRMQIGKRCLIAGFAISLVGILAYCLTTINDASPSHEWLSKSTIICLGTALLGFIVWLTGAINYLNAAIDAGEDSENIF